MPEPGGSLLLAAHQRNPLIAAATEALPDVRVAVHPSRFLGLLEWASRRCADAVRKGLVIPECRILEDKPPPGLADSAPALSLVSVATDPSGSIEIPLKP